ncbi:BTAD domain-containing putative transcriptional regulator [Lentzea sp. NPDC003310]|uniref:BTAD domain-containing putative transcriptional regulator n=1 Tax=Lentzea sp. NPDC003310 TaxID=3154447 RepID=UPI0033AF3FE1
MRSGRPWGALKGDDPARHDLARYMRGLVDHSELTLKAIGRHCGCSDTTVSKQLAGEDLPPWKFVAAVVQACTPGQRQQTDRERVARQLWQRAVNSGRPAPPPAEPILTDAHTRLVRAQEETIATQRRLIEVTDELSTARRQMLDSVQVEHRSSQAIMVLQVVLIRLSGLIVHLTAERNRYLDQVADYQLELDQTHRKLSDAERERDRAKGQIGQAKQERERASALTEVLHDKITWLEEHIRQLGVSPPDPGESDVVIQGLRSSTAEEILIDTTAGLDRLQRLLDAHEEDLAELESATVNDARLSREAAQDRLASLLNDISLHSPSAPGTNADTRNSGGADDDKWRLVAECVRQQLDAKRVVLWLHAEPQEAPRGLIAGSPLPPRTCHDDLGDDVILLPPDTQVRYIRFLDADKETADALAARDAQEVLVALLRGATTSLGVLEVHDRISGASFDATHINFLGTVASRVSTVMDNRQLMARLRHDAYHDPLTGLLNRPGFREAVSEPMLRAETAVVLRIDLELPSPAANDLGQSWSDQVVVIAGRRLRDELGRGVPLARFEGGAFAVLLLDAQAERAQQVAEHLRAALAAPYPADQLSIEVNVVMGWATTTNGESNEHDPDTLLKRADIAVRATTVGGPVATHQRPSASASDSRDELENASRIVPSSARPRSKAGLEFGVLGPLQVIADGRLVQLGRRGMRGLLAMLVVEANRLVPIDQIVNALWTDTPPATARTIVHGYVSRLRRVLEEADPSGSATICTTPTGYQLAVDPWRLDLHRARQLVASSRGKPAAIRAGLLREALGLWRGPVLADVPGDPMTSDLEELRLSALEERMEAELELGRHLELVGELRGLRTEYPFRERLIAQSMRALYRSGQRADALEVYQRFQRRAVEELGIDPGPQLRSLHEQMLRDDPTLS